MILEINGWDLNIKFSASHFIPFHGKCSRLHGHDYGIRVKITGTMNSSFMVYDFIELKKKLRMMIDKLDHHVLLPKQSKFMNIQDIENKVLVSFSDKEYVFPKEDVAFLNLEVTTAEAIAEYLLDEIVKMNVFDSNVELIELAVDEGIGQGVWAQKKLKK